MLRPTLAALALAGAAALAFSGAAQATTYFTTLSGPAESPANASPGTGTALVTINQVTNIMDVEVTFSGLVAPTTASHIHCCTAVPFTSTAIVATEVPFFDSFPIGVTSGSYTHLFNLLDLASYNPAFVTASGGTAAGAEAALVAGLNAGKAYLNIHTTSFPGGEIRGFLTAIPEPGTWLLTIVGFGVVGTGLRRRRAPARLAA
jgi:hypothetical protein